MKTKKEITRYLIVTPVIGAMDFGIYFLSKLFLPITVSKGISYVCAGITGYLFSKYWVFSKHKKCNPEMNRYWISDVTLLGYNVTANSTILHFWPHTVFLALVIASFSTAILSFILKKLWVFK